MYHTLWKCRVFAGLLVVGVCLVSSSGLEIHRVARLQAAESTADANRDQSNPNSLDETALEQEIEDLLGDEDPFQETRLFPNEGADEPNGNGRQRQRAAADFRNRSSVPRTDSSQFSDGPDLDPFAADPCDADSTTRHSGAEDSEHAAAGGRRNPVVRLVPIQFTANAMHSNRFPPSAKRAGLDRDPQSRRTSPPSLARFMDEIDIDRFDPANTFELYVGLPRLIQFELQPVRVQIGDEKLATGSFLEPREYSVVGLKLGSTMLNVWFADDPETDDVDESRRIHSYLLRVIPNPEFRKLLELEYREIEKQINAAFPESHIQLMLVGNRLILSGEAKDVREATYIFQIVQSNTRSMNRRNQGTQQTGAAGANFEPVDSDAIAAEAAAIENGEDPAPTTSPFALGTPGAPRTTPYNDGFVVNLLRVPGEQQVMLRVVVAEVNRSATRAIGLNFAVMNNVGNVVAANVTGGLLGTALNPGGSGGAGGGAAGGGNIRASLDNGQVLLAMNAMRTLGYARSLAEPNIVALNGQMARFQAGGQFPVPVISGFTSSGLQGVSFIPYGVIVQFVPIVTDRDRVRLTMRAEVSTREVGASTAIAGASVPSLSSRNFSTSVELREGQTLAVAGLIQMNLGANSDRVPGVGDLPFLGNFFSSQRIANAEQELVILITPEFVHPLDTRDGHEELPLPGADLYEPGDLEFYVKGRLESHRTTDYRSPARSEWDRMVAYRHCEQQYLDGPHGQSLQWSRPAPVETRGDTGPAMRYVQHPDGLPAVPQTSDSMFEEAQLPSGNVDTNISPAGHPADSSKRQNSSSPRVIQQSGSASLRKLR